MAQQLRKGKRFFNMKMLSDETLKTEAFPSKQKQNAFEWEVRWGKSVFAYALTSCDCISTFLRHVPILTSFS